jgi:hypothetical protein
MTWLVPAAFAGLGLLLLPVLAHLLGRDEPRRTVVPTLRFLDTTRAAPVRRTRLHDVPLLLLRLLVLLVAVLALARPTRPAADEARAVVAADSVLRTWPAVPVLIDAAGTDASAVTDFTPVQMRVLAALQDDADLRYALRAAFADTARALPGLVLLRADDGRPLLSASRAGDTLRLTTVLGSGAPALDFLRARAAQAAAPVTQRVPAGSDAPLEPQERLDAAPRRDDDRSPFARWLWAVVLLALGGEGLWRTRLGRRTPEGAA